MTPRPLVEKLESRFLLTAVSRPVDLPFRVGVNAPSWWHDEFNSVDSDNRIKELANNTDANTFEIVPSWYMFDKFANSISVDQTKTAEDGAVIHAIQLAKSLGLSVILKPHVEIVNDTAWRGEIQPTDKNAWFASYKTFINHYAQMAKDQGASMFVVGTELKSMNGSAYTTQWNSVIDGIRAIYSGPLTYAANWDDFKSIGFWNKLDVIGIDEYSPLGAAGSYEATPATDVLVQRWQSIVNDISGWRTQQGFSQHVLLTEVGFVSTADTHRQHGSTSGTADPAAQQRCYDATNQVWSSQDWMDGVLWWDWVADPSNKSWSPIGKPAENALKFGSISGSIFSDGNANGIKDAGESALANWQVYLDANNNNLLDAGEYVTTTNANGNYTIGNLLYGNYQVRSVVKSGFRKSNLPGLPGYNLLVTDAQVLTNQNFAMTTTARLSGTVFNDANQNQMMDGGEVGMSAVRIYIDFNNNGLFDVSEPNKFTDASGAYRFGALLAGSGTLRVEKPAGWNNTVPASGQYTGTVSSGEIVGSVNFGLFKPAPAPAMPQSIAIAQSSYSGSNFFDDDLAGIV